MVVERPAVADQDQLVVGQRHGQRADADEVADVDVLAAREVDVDRRAAELAVEHGQAVQVDGQLVADEVDQAQAGHDVRRAEVVACDVDVEVADVVDRTCCRTSVGGMGTRSVPVPYRRQNKLPPSFSARSV